MRLGVGKNMVEAMRFWAIALGILAKCSDPEKPRTSITTPTCLGTALLDTDIGLDPYVEDISTLWILHWHGISAPTSLPVWWITFNDFFPVEFTEDQLIAFVQSKLESTGWPQPKLSSLKKDVDCLLRMYSSRFPRGRQSIDDLIDSPFRELDRNARVNDPLYMTAPSSTPEPFDIKPMFRPYGETGEERIPIDFNGKTYHVTLRFSFAKVEARVRDDGKDAGHEPYGKHARKNVGVSVVRADRELELDTSWVNSSDPRDRWWGAEIDFPPELDDVFGVTNNKQSATHFNQMVMFYSDENLDQDWVERKAEWEADGDPRLHLINICNRLVTHRNKMRNLLRQQAAGTRTAKQQRHEDRTADRATQKFKERQIEGFTAEHDEVPLDKQKIANDLIDKGYAERTAREITDAVEQYDRRVIFVAKDNPESTSFFHPEFLPGVTEIVFNTSHPAYHQLVQMLDLDLATYDVDTLKTRIHGASDTLKMLLCAWARYEMEEREGSRRERVAEVRQEWGKMARQFLADSDINLIALVE